MAATPPYERIVFDCDSTLTGIEGVDELPSADRDEIARLTRDAMEGRVPLEQIYGRRLELIRPTRDDVARVGSRYIEKAMPQSRGVLAALRSLGKELRIVSGGLHFAVASFGRWLGVTDAGVDAVRVSFDSTGRFLGYDEHSPLTRSDGKRDVLAALPPKKTAFVGDGVTDARARDVIDTFICYAGVVRREDVAAVADVVVEGPDYGALLPVLCTQHELDLLRRDPRHAAVVPESGALP